MKDKRIKDKGAFASVNPCCSKELYGDCFYPLILCKMSAYSLVSEEVGGIILLLISIRISNSTETSRVISI
jgi:hypothetical protein